MVEQPDKNIMTSMLFPPEMFHDMKDYLKENELKFAEFMRALVRREIYQEKTLSKKV